MLTLVAYFVFGLIGCAVGWLVAWAQPVVFTQIKKLNRAEFIDWFTVWVVERSSDQKVRKLKSVSMLVGAILGTAIALILL